MFQLIVAVISIALVAVLAIASTYYGGTAFTQSQQKAQITALVNAGEQIAGANALYVTDWGQSAATVNALVVGANNTTYLASAPVDSAASAGQWQIGALQATVALKYGGTPSADTFCTAVDVQSGQTVSGGTTMYLAATTLPLGVQFGCVGTNATPVFAFRL